MIKFTCVNGDIFNLSVEWYKNIIIYISIHAHIHLYTLHKGNSYIYIYNDIR